MTREELERIVIHYMDAFTTMTLACCIEAKPWAADVFLRSTAARSDLLFISFFSPLHTPFDQSHGCRHNTRRLQGMERHQGAANGGANRKHKRG